ncbi:hypothetical protein K503DRAFT_775396 [Rhizopogon vinicolor AM-OR11-026]|uniref:Uncharacterized protein n=1 Tax=Rhizopogon vinicolor AM-OR11-026 TaxID=1314800 RepID=A0A1B7MM23_9AGAM|nr:hypothetical protein K503DRAFT_775396 [Rhizopogon vinicolor AM-OR11-026]
MPMLLLPQPRRQRLDRLSSTIPDPFISTYLFNLNSCHSLNPYLHHHSSIRSATVFNRTTTHLSFLVSPTAFTDRTPSPLPLTIPGRPVLILQYK